MYMSVTSKHRSKNTDHSGSYNDNNSDHDRDCDKKDLAAKENDSFGSPDRSGSESESDGDMDGDGDGDKDEDSEDSEDSEDDCLLTEEDIRACDEERIEIAKDQRGSSIVRRAGAHMAFAKPEPASRWISEMKKITRPTFSDPHQAQIFERRRLNLQAKEEEYKKIKAKTINSKISSSTELNGWIEKVLEEKKRKEMEENLKQRLQEKLEKEENDPDFFTSQTQVLTEDERKLHSLQYGTNLGIGISTNQNTNTQIGT